MLKFPLKAKLRKIYFKVLLAIRRWARFSKISPWKSLWIGGRKTTVGAAARLALLCVLVLWGSYSFVTKDTKKHYTVEGTFFSRSEEELYFERPKAKPPVKPAPPRPTKPALKLPAGIRVAIILDDAGADFIDYRRIYAIKQKLTISVLPGLPASARVVRDAVAHGKEPMLHLPMEPGNEKYVRYTGDMILRTMGDAEIIDIVSRDADSMPGVRGVNNHMGSSATEDMRVMRAALSEIRRRGLFFLDSRTSSKSIAASAAAEWDIPFARNMVFLDVDGTADGVRMRFAQLIDLAKKEKTAVGIGHVTRPETIRVLAELMPKYASAGIEFVYASTVVK